MKGEEVKVDYYLLKEIFKCSKIFVNIFDANTFDTFYVDDYEVRSITRGSLGSKPEGILKVLKFAYMNNNFESETHQYEKEGLIWKKYKKE